MKNIFRRSKSPHTTKEMVEMVHNEFYTAGEEAVREAKSILISSSEETVKKVASLAEYGFSNAKECVEHKEKQRIQHKAKDIAEALQHFSILHPQYKFIPKNKVEDICKKHSLVVGPVNLYKGFVPRKNLLEIEKFFFTKNDINWEYREEFHGYGFHHYSNIISEEEYKRLSKEERDFGGREYSLREGRKRLIIAAPEKDMKTDWHTKKGNFLVPDPIVMVELSYKSIEIYCIITAWGDEASDENVINQKMN